MEPEKQGYSSEGKRRLTRDVSLEIDEEDLAQTTEGGLLALIEGVLQFKHPHINAWIELSQIMGADPDTVKKAKAGQTYIGSARWVRTLAALPWAAPVYLRWESLQFEKAKQAKS